MRGPAVILLGAVILVAAIPGCAVLEPEPELQAHELAPTLPPPAAAAPVAGSLFVGPIKAHPPYATNQIAYRKRAFELDFFSRNVWAAEPAAMLAPWLVESLESSGLFTAVVSGVGAPATRYRLDSELIILRQEFDGSPSRVRLVMRFQLVDLESRELVGWKRFDLETPAPSADAYGGVVASNRLFSQLLSELTGFCANALGGA